MKRKKIGLITVCPEKEYPQRVMNGVFSQCEKYGYDVVVFSPLASVSSFNKEYLSGEFNIFELINFNLLDGIIVTPITITESNQFSYLEKLLVKFKEECRIPVVSIDMPFGDYPTVFTDDKLAFYHITEHLIKNHGCKNFSVLSGVQTVSITDTRVEGIRECLIDNNLTLNDEQIYPGDFWYTSGENLANRYISKELPLPDAVICLSDFMAIGLTNQLIKNGIKVPEQVIVSGYDSVLEASVNNPPITTYLPDHSFTGASAVNYLHKIISPSVQIINSTAAREKNICIGGSCGCKPDFEYTRKVLSKSVYSWTHDFSHSEINQNVNMAILLDSYMTEKLTASVSPVECLGKIYEYNYLLQPFKNFYICLNTNCLDENQKIEKGYTNTMQQVLSAEGISEDKDWRKHVFFGNGKEIIFQKEQMFPPLLAEYPVPQVYYFVPIHFDVYSLGYAVLQNDLFSQARIGDVFRNFIRTISNAFEMIRTKYEFSYLSEHDSMTGLYNRRGMERLINNKIANSNPEDKLFAIVVDMDGLKIRNDTYGHAEGDKGIIAVAQAVTSITSVSEICVRGGGDEFYVLGIGKYTQSMLKEKLSRFTYYLDTKNDILNVPVSASIGYYLDDVNIPGSYSLILEKADANMYKNKREKKAARE